MSYHYKYLKYRNKLADLVKNLEDQSGGADDIRLGSEGIDFLAAVKSVAEFLSGGGGTWGRWGQGRYRSIGHFVPPSGQRSGVWEAVREGKGEAGCYQYIKVQGKHIADPENRQIVFHVHFDSEKNQIQYYSDPPETF
jgi:hypothetical protein